MEIYGRARSEKKELIVLEGWSHYDIYDKPEPVGKALEKVIPFFKGHLGVTDVAREISQRGAVAAE
jgi:uncharacterized protein